MNDTNRNHKLAFERDITDAMIRFLTEHDDVFSSPRLSAVATNAALEGIKAGRYPETVMPMTKGYQNPTRIVNSAMVNNILATVPEVHDHGVLASSDYGVGKARHWSTKAYLKTREDKRIHHETTWAVAREHIRVREIWDRFDVVRLNYTVASFWHRKSTGMYIAGEEQTETVVSKDVAQKTAEAYALTLRREYMREMMAG